MPRELSSDIRHSIWVSVAEHTNVFRQPFKEKVQEERIVPPIPVPSIWNRGVEKSFTPVQCCFCKSLRLFSQVRARTDILQEADSMQCDSSIISDIKKCQLQNY